MTASAKEVIAAALLDGARNTTAAERAMPIDQRIATAILSALNAAGYVVVPREPTPAMVAAAWDGIAKEKTRLGIARLGPGPGTTDVYRAMIAAGEKQ